MYFQSQLLCKIAFGTFLILWAQASADFTDNEESLINSCLIHLNPEYADYIADLNHKVKGHSSRCKQNIPEKLLREILKRMNNYVERNQGEIKFKPIRTGRSINPELLSRTLEKRWFDEVKQKPIRSPSLRLRFGRNDPSMPIHSPYDILINGQQTVENNEDYNDVYDRMARMNNEINNDLLDSRDEVNDMAVGISGKDYYNSLGNLLLSLNRYDDNQKNEMDTEDMALHRYNRVIRKTAPLRLRWGRSTGGKSTVLEQKDNVKCNFDNKNNQPDVSNDVDNTVNQQNKD